MAPTSVSEMTMCLTNDNGILSARTTHHPESNEVVPDRGHAPRAARGPQDPGSDPVGAPAQDVGSTSRRSTRGMDSLRHIRTIPVPAPFPDIAYHVVEPPGVGLFLANRLDAPASILVITTHSLLMQSLHPHRTSALWCQPGQHTPIPPQWAGSSRSRFAPSAPARDRSDNMG
jgi:hypothetical protein